VVGDTLRSKQLGGLEKRERTLNDMSGYAYDPGLSFYEVKELQPLNPASVQCWIRSV